MMGMVAMRVLVTGGAGYIGSHTVAQLQQRGDVVVVLDSLRTGHRAALGDVQFVQGDSADSALIARLCRAEHIEAVLHFAALKSVGESMAEPARYFENNVHKTAVLLETLRLAGVSRFIFSSSAAVYGTPREVPVRETSLVHPENPYAASKAMVEQMLAWFERCHGMRYVSLRYFNAAGAAPDAAIGEDFSTATNLVPLVMKTALGKMPAIPIFGTDYPTPDGTCIRDYIHVVDLAAAHLHALDYVMDGGSSEIFNLGIGKGYSVAEVIERARRISARPIPVISAPRRPGDAAAIWADVTKARNTLHWQPKYDLEAILHTAWCWHATHPDGYAAEQALPLE
jgi:UDP-glucose 4-epimerase